MASNGMEQRSGQFSDPEPESDSPEKENSPHRLANPLLTWYKANAAKGEESRPEATAGGTVPGIYSFGQEQPNGPQDINGYQQFEQPPSQTTTGWRGRGRTHHVKDQPQVSSLPLMGKLLRSPSPQQMYGRGWNAGQQINSGSQVDPQPPQQINGQSEIKTNLIDVSAPSQPAVAVPEPRRAVYVPPQRRNGGGHIDYQNPPDHPDMPPRGPIYGDYQENRSTYFTLAEIDENWRQRK